MTEKDCILVVDDDEGTRKSLALLLKRKGFETEQAETGKEALAIAEGRAINLTLLDIKLPDIEGIQLLAPLKKTNPDMSVIMITGFASVENAVQSLTAGASGYITKPIDLDGMLAMIKTTFDQQHLVTEVRQAEEAIRESEEKFRGIFNNVNDAIHLHEIGKDGNLGTFIDVNDIACQMLQYARDEMLHHTPLDFTGDYHSRPIDKIQEELVTGGNAVFETEHIRKDGTVVPVEINAHVITLMGKKMVLSVVRDITERKRTDEQIRNSLVQIENDLVQMALFNDQIRNPLAVIIALLDSDHASKTNTKICEQVYKIDALITTLDRQYMNSEKVREFLRKHYDFIQRSGL